jgi:hypothetical protein
MSNLTLFSSGSSIVPDYLKGVTDSTTKEIAGSSGGKQISIRGSVWRMMVGGEEVAKNEDRGMNFVVVASGKGITRTYYEGKYEEGKDSKPACWSAEGDKPAAEVPYPKGQTCQSCPMNIEGSGEGKSRACRFSKRLAVVLEGDIGGSVYRLSVPAKSYFGKAEGEKMPLQAFGKFLAGHNIPVTGIVTEARFDTNESVPVLKFRAVRPLTKPEWELAKSQSLTDDAKQAIEVKMVPSKAESEGNAPALPQAFKDAPVPSEEVEATAEPIKRAKKVDTAPAPSKDVAAILNDWASDDGE